MIKNNDQQQTNTNTIKINKYISMQTQDSNINQQRSKIMSIHQIKKDDSKTIQKQQTKQQIKPQQKQTQKGHQLLTQDSQIKYLPKMPSYFLQVQQQSVIMQQNYQTSDHSQKQQSSPKIKKLQSIKSPKKYINTLNINTSQNIKSQRLTKLVYSSQIYIYNGQQNQLQQKNAYIWDRFLCIGDIKINLNQITKIKCLLQAVSPSQRKIKIVQNQNNLHYFAACTKLCAHSSQKFNQHYLWFSKIICNKLQSIKHLLKYPKSSKQQLQIQNPTNILGKQIIKGNIYKKSQHLQNWQLRYIVITQTQLFSYKQNINKYTFNIKSEHVKYIWTRFDIHNGYLIIKVKHGLTKTQFGIPIQDYCQVMEGNWLYAFYRLMVYGKNQEKQEY